MKETYSAGMLAAVLEDLRTMSTQRLAELAPYYRHRGGPGAQLVANELRRRLLRRQVNYPRHAD